MSKKLCLAKHGLTKYVLDAGDSAAFPSIFVVSRFYAQTESTAVPSPIFFWMLPPTCYTLPWRGLPTNDTGIDGIRLHSIRQPAV